MNKNELINKLNGLLCNYDGPPICKILLHKDDIETLKESDFFDAIPNPTSSVKGMFLGTPIGEVDYNRSGIVGIELYPEDFLDLKEEELKHWYEDPRFYKSSEDNVVYEILKRFDNLLQYELFDKAIFEFNSIKLEKLPLSALLTVLMALKPRSNLLPWDEIFDKVSTEAKSRIPGSDQKEFERVDKLLSIYKVAGRGTTVTEFAASFKRD